MSEPIYRIEGGARLQGSVTISGAKNAATSCMAATLLTDDPCVIQNLPEINDVGLFGELLGALGVRIGFDREARTVSLRAGNDLLDTPPDDLVAKQRASFVVMGPLLARLGRAACAAPGGDIIGERPLDVHLGGFAALGARVENEGGRIVVTADRLIGRRVVLEYPSVLGTQNLVLAAVRAEGRTTIVNAAMEPEVVCLSELLNKMGARVGGAGGHTIEIDGVERLHGAEHALIPDRIEAGTFAVATAITGGETLLRGANPRHLDALLYKLGEIGVEVEEDAAGVVVRAPGPLHATNIQAVPYPGLATDLQALVATLLTQADGVSVVQERVFESRLQYVGELRKMGATIKTAGTTATVQGPARLHGATVQGRDVRSAAALTVAGLAAEGVTEVLDITHLERGYECLDAKLRGLGAQVFRRTDIATLG